MKYGNYSSAPQFLGVMTSGKPVALPKGHYRNSLDYKISVYYAAYQRENILRQNPLNQKWLAQGLSVC